MRRLDLRSRVLRVSMAIGLALSTAGAQRLAVPTPAAAGVCGPFDAYAYPDPQTTGDPAYTTLEDTVLQVAAPGVLANDECVGTVEAITKANESGGTFTFATSGGFTYTPVTNGNGVAGVDYLFTSEEHGPANLAHVTITVIPVNDRPEIVQYPPDSDCDGFTVAEDSGYFNSTLCTWFGRRGGLYEDAQVLTGHASTNHPEFFSAGPTFTPGQFETGVPFSFTLAANAWGTATISLWVTDNGGKANGGLDTSTKVTIDLTVTPLEDAPVTVGETYLVPFDTAFTRTAAQGVLKNDTDIDGNGLTAQVVTGPAHGMLGLQPNGAFTYTPADLYSGPDSFTYRATNAGGTLHSTATVTLNVLAPGATPGPPTPSPRASSTAAPTPTSSTGPLSSVLASPVASASSAASPSAAPSGSTGPSAAPSASPTQPPTGFQPSTAPPQPVVDPNPAAGDAPAWLLPVGALLVIVSVVLLARRRRSAS